MLFRKLWRTMGLYRAQFISMILMITLGVGVFFGFNMEWYSIEQNTEEYFDKTGFADYRIVAESGVSREDAEKIAAISGVEAVSRFLSVTADVKEQAGDSVALTVTENAAVSGMLPADGAEYDAASKDGIWLSKKYAEANGVSLGDTLTFSFRGIEISGRVAGFVYSGEYLICVRDESQLMPDYSTHGFAYISPEMYRAALGMDYYPQLNVRSDLSKKDFTEAADAALGETLLILTKEENGSYAGASGEAEEGKTMGSILPVIFLLIAVLTMVTTMHRLAVKEKIQIGTLKALGFKDRRILLHYTSFAAVIGVLGTALGTGLGFFIAWYIMNPNGMMGTYFDMPRWRLVLPWFCWILLVVIPVLLSLIGYLSTRQMLKGTAADALRPYTPKKMRALAMERTKLFHKLPFGARWNLRDTMRHKARTGMSLLGVISCSLIIVAVLGMSDTMDAFLDLYYDGATNYSSRIFLTEDATAGERTALAEKYEGDWSASVSVQIEEKTVSLDIYSVTHDKVRFPDQKDNFITPADDGAYLCMRLAREFDLAPGDTFTVSPYGSEERYTLRVAGLIRSVSECIVITPAYADTLGLSYQPDSVYTDTVKENVAADHAIKSVQSKQMIMDSFDTFMELMNLMIAILIVAAMLLGVIVLYNLGVMSYTERYRELATLKVVGFKDRKIAGLLIGQNMWTTAAGIVLGIPAGVGTLSYLIVKLASEFEMRVYITARSYIISAALTFGVSLIVSLMVARKNKKINMVEALKAAE